MIRNLFTKAVWLKQCAPFPSEFMQKIGQIHKSRFGRRPKTSKIGHLIPYYPRLKFFCRKEILLKRCALLSFTIMQKIRNIRRDCIVQNDKLYRVRLGSVVLVALSQISQYVITEMELKVVSRIMLVDIYCWITNCEVIVNDCEVPQCKYYYERRFVDSFSNAWYNKD